MPHISLDDFKISVSLKDLKISDVDWRLNSFFNEVGAIFNESNNSFIFEKPHNMKNLYQILVDTRTLFDEKKFTTTFDEESKNILSRTAKSTLDFNQAKEIGSKIKISNNINLDLPNFFERTLYDYQKQSVKHLSEVGNAANFSVPGSGKTTLSYAAYSILKNKGIVNKILVVSPRSAFVPWEEEFLGCFGREPETIRLDGSRVDAHMDTDTQNKELVLCTYLLPLNHQYAVSRFLEKNKVLMILDESHNIKNMEGKTAGALLDLSSSATRRFILSGTPMPNKWEDVWTQFNFLWPIIDILDKKHVFREYTRIRQDLGDYAETINPLFTRITKKALGLKLPRFEEKYVPMSRIQQRIYDAIELKVKQEIENLHEESITESVQMDKWRKAKMIRLIQTASNPALLTKMDTEFNLEPISDEGLNISELIEQYTELDEFPPKLQEAVLKTKELMDKGEKVVLWTNFRHNIDTLKKLFKNLGITPLWVDGRVPKDESEDIEHNREKMIQEFKEDLNPRVFIATPASCAESVSLHMYKGRTVCSNAIYVDRTYNAGQYMQSLDRIHRIGMSPNTQVTYWLYMAQNTFDERIHKKLSKKIDNMYDLLDDDLRIIDLDVTETILPSKEIEDNFQDLKSSLNLK
jgi:SNF2 family DNA or RNA helicase